MNFALVLLLGGAELRDCVFFALFARSEPCVPVWGPAAKCPGLLVRAGVLDTACCAPVGLPEGPWLGLVASVFLCSLALELCAVSF